MRFSKKWMAALAGALVLTGCVSMNADDCKTADWAALGRDDALNGRSIDTAKLRADECRKFGYGINSTAYEEGRQSGLRDFCTPEGGAAFGSKGGDYTPGYCPAGMEPRFLYGYTPAHNRYQLQRKVENLRSEIDYREHEIRKIRSKGGDIDVRRIEQLESEIRHRHREIEDLLMMRD